MARLLSNVLWLGAMGGMTLCCLESRTRILAQPVTQTRDQAPLHRYGNGDLSIIDGQPGRTTAAGKPVSLAEVLANLDRQREEGVYFGLHELTEDDVAALRSLPNLRRVLVCGQNTTDASLERVSRLTNLRDVTFSHTRMTDKGLDHLKALKKLEKLWISDGWNGISDTGLASLAEMPELRELRLSGGMIGDEGLAFLGKLDKLRLLDLFGGRVTDAGLANLKQLTALRQLTLHRAKVSDGGLKLLREALPKCEIIR